MSNRNDIKLIEISEAAYRWLTALGNKVDKQFLKEEMFSHPDYPALTSFIDVLDAGNFEYAARRAGFEEKETFTYPCIINVTLANGSAGLYYAENNTALEAALDYWNGIIIYAPQKSIWSHPQNEAQIRAGQRKTRIVIAVFSILLLLSFTVSFLTAQNILFSLWALTAALGLITGTLLVAQEMGLSTELVQKVCGIGGSRSGCSAVLNSKQAKGKYGISIATLAWSYFCAQWLVILLSPFAAPAVEAAAIIMKLSPIGLLIAGWSLYTQKFVIKNWCTLCLGIVAVLVTQSILSFTFYHSFQWHGLLYFAPLLSITVLLLLPVKNWAEQLQGLDRQATELKRWKRDTYMFLNQWKEQPLVDCAPFSQDEIELANPDGILRFTIACNPYCPPCASTHKTFSQLIRLYGEHVSVQVRFGIDAEDKDKKHTQAVNLIHNAIAETNAAKTVVHDWFERMDAKAFAEHYGLTAPIDYYDALKQQELWTEYADIKFTPTVFLNGRVLPRRYDIADIIPMIPEIYDQFENNMI